MEEYRSCIFSFVPFWDLLSRSAWEVSSNCEWTKFHVANSIWTCFWTLMVTSSSKPNQIYSAKWWYYGISGFHLWSFILSIVAIWISILRGLGFQCSPLKCPCPSLSNLWEWATLKTEKSWKVNTRAPEKHTGQFYGLLFNFRKRRWKS